MKTFAQPVQRLDARAASFDAAGSRGAHRIVGGRRVQAKLLVGRLDDPLEREADRVADQALSIPAGRPGDATPPPIQPTTNFPNGYASLAPAAVDQALAEPGSALDDGLRRDMEGRLGFDFSQVRVHTGAAAADSAGQLTARAYTTGRDIVFGPGQFVPGTQQGRRLIAHELTHVVQQAQPHGHQAPVVRRAPRQDAGLFRIISDVWRVAGRDIVIVETEGGIVRAFYRRTGDGYKGVGHAPPTRGWAPFQGLEPHPGNPTKPWLNKNHYYNTVHPDNPLRGYGNTLNRDIAGWLDNQYVPEGVETRWEKVREQMDGVMQRGRSLAPVSPPAVAVSGEVGGGRGSGGGGAKPSAGPTSSPAAKVETTAGKVESAAAKVEVKAVAAEGAAAVELATTAAKGGRLARLGAFLLAAAMPGPQDVLFLWIGFFGSLAAAKAKLRQDYYALGFAEGLSANLLGFPRSEAISMLVKTGGRPSIGEKVAGFEGVRDRGTHSGAIDGLRFAAMLTTEQRTAFLQEGWGKLVLKGHRVGSQFTFNDVLAIALALKPTVVDLLELAQEQEEQRRRRQMVEGMHKDTESMWQK